MNPKFLVIPIALSFGLSLVISLYYPIPIGADFHFHMKITKLYRQGKLAMLEPDILKVNNLPYPPLFHFMLILVVEPRILQALFYPLALTASTFLVWKIRGTREALYTNILLLGSTAFFDRSIQVIPQAIEIILYPLATYYFLKGRNIPFVLVSLIMIYTHGLPALLLICPFILYCFINKREQYEGGKGVFLSIFGFIPFAAFTIPYLLQGLTLHSGIQNPQELAFLQNPAIFTLYYLGLPLPLLFLFAFVQHSIHWKITPLHKIAYYTLISLSPLLIFWPDRFFTYASMPLAFLGAKFLDSLKLKSMRAFFLIIVGFFAIYGYAEKWLWLLTNSYHVIS